MVKVTSLLAKAGSGLRFSFGVRAWTEMEIQCIKGMQRNFHLLKRWSELIGGACVASC